MVTYSIKIDVKNNFESCYDQCGCKIWRVARRGSKKEKNEGLNEWLDDIRCCLAPNFPFILFGVHEWSRRPVEGTIGESIYHHNTYRYCFSCKITHCILSIHCMHRDFVQKQTTHFADNSKYVKLKFSKGQLLPGKAKKITSPSVYETAHMVKKKYRVWKNATWIWVCHEKVHTS